MNSVVYQLLGRHHFIVVCYVAKVSRFVAEDGTYWLLIIEIWARLAAPTSVGMSKYVAQYIRCVVQRGHR